MTLPKIPYYHVDSLISSGGTANVYLGVNANSGFPVAIKELFPNRAKDKFIMQRFREEANHYLYLSQNNEHITKLVDFVEYEDKFFLIMEFIDGKPLDDYINTGRSPAISEAVIIPMFCSILDTIDYLHQNNVLHLDIKPGNIMVVKESQIKILDMGISATLNDKTKNPKKCGTPAFMAPEQINQGELGRYTDIFALGITFFNLITGQLPFTGSTHTEIFEKICTKPTPLATDFYAGVNPKFQAVIERALQKESCKRYQTCKEFKEAILKIEKVTPKNSKTMPLKEITIGRDPDNKVVINDNFVSGKHLKINIYNAETVKITDLNSRNGTFVNGKRITGEAYISAKDILKIGNTVLPWHNFMQMELPDDIPAKESHDRQKKSNNRESIASTTPKKTINWMSILSAVMMIMSLIMMLIFLSRYLFK